MNFKEATDNLFGNVSHENLAKVLGVSIASIRQARLNPGAAAHRTPPDQWQMAVIQLAEERMEQLRDLATRLRREVTSHASTPAVKKSAAALSRANGINNLSAAAFTK
jgi:hypothetical protein